MYAGSSAVPCFIASRTKPARSEKTATSRDESEISCSGMPPGCTPSVRPAAARRSIVRPSTERALRRRSASRKPGVAKSTGATPGYQRSGSPLTVWRPQCMSAMHVYAPCGCHTTMWRRAASGGVATSTVQRAPQTCMSWENHQARSLASQRGPCGVSVFRCGVGDG